MDEHIKEFALMEIRDELIAGDILALNDKLELAKSHWLNASQSLKSLLKNAKKSKLDDEAKKIVAHTLIRFPYAIKHLVSFSSAIDSNDERQRNRLRSEIDKIIFYIQYRMNKKRKCYTRASSIIVILVSVLVIAFYARLLSIADNPTNLPDVANQNHYDSFCKSRK
jgi:hypothetical protein